MTDETNLRQFRAKVIPTFRDAVLAQDTAIHEQHGSFVTIINERNSATTFAFTISMREPHCILEGVLQSDGKIQVRTLPGETQTYELSDVTRDLACEIVIDWLKAIGFRTAPTF